ncbi:MAG: hypothetical protein U1E52_18480 [Geminicoccaceae bacterium]
MLEQATGTAVGVAGLARRSLFLAAAGACATLALPTQTMAASVPLRSVPKKLPPPTRELLVPEAFATVRAALEVARAGDHISLADGSYSGDQEWSWSGGTGDGRFLVIKARSRHRAVFTGRIRLLSPYLWVNGLRTTFMGPDYDWGASQAGTNDYYALRVETSHVRVTRCAIQSLGGLRIYDPSPSLSDIIIAYNDFTGARPNRFLGAQLFIGDVVAKSRGPTEVDIAYNYFNDIYPHPSSLPGGIPVPINERMGIYLGHSKPGDNPTGTNLSIRIHHNVLLGHRAYAIYTKRHTYIGFNYVRTVAPPHFYNQVGFRHGGGPPGGGGIIEGNFANGVGYFVNDTGARVLGNVAPNGSIRLFCGAGIWEEASGRYDLLRQAASDTLIVGNRVRRYAVGVFRPSTKPQVLLESEGGRVENVRIFMDGHGTAGDVDFRPKVPLPGPDHQPGPLTEPYLRSTIQIDPAGDGGYAYPTAITSSLLGQVGTHA